MINYRPLPSRVRRIVKQYDYCIETVLPLTLDKSFYVKFKDGYQSKEGQTEITVKEMDKFIYLFKGVVKPSSREIKTALFGFPCPVCGVNVKKGANFADIGGLKICMYCNVQD